VAKGAGLFGSAVLRKFPCLAVEEEGRLRNPRIKEHFLTKLFTWAAFRKIKASSTSPALMEFHSKNKLLFKAYNPKETEVLGRIVAKKAQKSIGPLIEDYQRHLCNVLRRPPTCGSNVNVMMHAMGYFSAKLSSEEKRFFRDSLQQYKKGVLPSSVNISILRLRLAKFKERYLLKQTFFKPYPLELMDIETMTAYCDGKDYWK
jgi:uncharacterized protein YbgA (DUF1722 family)